MSPHLSEASGRPLYIWWAGGRFGWTDHQKLADTLTVQSWPGSAHSAWQCCAWRTPVQRLCRHPKLIKRSWTAVNLTLASKQSCAYLISTVLLQTVQQPACVGQPERNHFKIISSPLLKHHKNTLKTYWSLYWLRPKLLSMYNVLHLNDSFNAADGGIEQSADSLIIVNTVSIS